MSDLPKNYINESSEDKDSTKIPNINEYDKLFSHLLNMNLFKAKNEGEGEDEGDGDGDGEGDGEDEGEGEYEGEGEDEGEGEYEGEGEDEDEDEGEGEEEGDILLSTKWEIINKLVESHLNITNSVTLLLKNS